MNAQTDEQLDRLANYFIYHNLLETRGWTFYEFVDKYLNGRFHA